MSDVFKPLPMFSVSGLNDLSYAIPIHDEGLRAEVESIVERLRDQSNSDGLHMQYVIREWFAVPEEHWAEAVEMLEEELNAILKEAGADWHYHSDQPIPRALYDVFLRRLGTEKYTGSSFERRIIMRHTYFNREVGGLRYLADMSVLLAESVRKNEKIDAAEAALMLTTMAAHMRTAANIYDPDGRSDESAAALQKKVGIFTIAKASEMTGVPEIEIVDAIRTGELRADYQARARFLVPFTGETICHRDYLVLAGDEVDRIHVNLTHRRDHLNWLAVERGRDDGIRNVKAALVVWYGALLDDPHDMEAAGMVQALGAIARQLGLREDGTIADEQAPA